MGKETVRIRENTVSDRPLSSPRWGQERRLEFIDFRLLWDGAVNRADLVDFFRISMQQASADLATYIQLAPGNLEYDRSLKAYQATSKFSPALGGGDAQAFLDQLSAISAGTLVRGSSFVGWAPPYDAVRLPARAVSTQHLARILRAIRNKSDIEISYQSMRRPSPTVRWISPHALGYDGSRWHVRAGCYENNDFVLSRVQRVGPPRQNSGLVAVDDAWWNTEISIVVKPNPQLTAAQRAAIEADFSMVRGRLTVKCRKAMAFYILRHLHLEDSDRPNSASQPIELVNRKELVDIFEAAKKVHALRMSA